MVRTWYWSERPGKRDQPLQHHRVVPARLAEGAEPVWRGGVVIGDPAGGDDLHRGGAAARGRVVPALHLDVGPVTGAGCPVGDLDAPAKGGGCRHRDVPGPVVVPHRLPDAAVGEQVQPVGGALVRVTVDLQKRLVAGERHPEHRTRPGGVQHCPNLVGVAHAAGPNW